MSNKHTVNGPVSLLWSSPPHLVVVEGVVDGDVPLHGDGDGHEDGARHGDHVTGVQHVL